MQKADSANKLDFEAPDLPTNGSKKTGSYVKTWEQDDVPDSVEVQGMFNMMSARSRPGIVREQGKPSNR